MKWFCNHDWSKWSKIIHCYTAPYQFRYCEKCNLIRKRRASLTSNEVNTVLWNHGEQPIKESESE